MLDLDPMVQELLRDPMLLQAVLFAGSMGWPSSYRDLMETPYRLFVLICAVRAAQSPTPPS